MERIYEKQFSTPINYRKDDDDTDDMKEINKKFQPYQLLFYLKLLLVKKLIFSKMLNHINYIFQIKHGKIK